MSERAVLGIALHDDARVAGMLKSFIATSQNQRIRSSSTYWLGNVGGEQAFLATMVRNDAEDKKLRRTAAYEIASFWHQGTMNTLKELYETVKDLEIHRVVISAAGNSVDTDVAYAFLLTVAKNDPDWESRTQQPFAKLGRFQCDDVADELIKDLQHLD